MGLEQKATYTISNTDMGCVNQTPRTSSESAADHYLHLIRAEVFRSIVKHPKPFSSHHEAHSVLREEFEEYWDVVKAQTMDHRAAVCELIQTAAMALRALIQLENPLLKDLS